VSFQKFLDDLDEAKRELRLKPVEECLFRGSGAKSFGLLPSLHWRYEKSLGGSGKNLSKDKHLLKLQEIEASLFWDFSARARELLSGNLTDWEILFTMRHHGVATRLLDWTTVVGVAIYFALDASVSGSKPCIWLLNPYRLNELTAGFKDIQIPRYLAGQAGAADDWDYGDLLADWDDLGIGWKHPVAVQAPQRDARLHAQRGYFTIHGNDRRSIHLQSCSKTKLSDFLRCVEMPADARSDAKAFLRRAGIDRYLLFPDLDNLGRLLHETYGL